MTFWFARIANQKFGLVGLLIAAMIVASAILFSTATIRPVTALLGLAIIWTSLIPGLIYLTERDRAPIPFFPVAGLFYALFFGLPVFTLPISRNEIGRISAYGITLIDEIRDPVLALVWAGVALMVIAFYVAKHIPMKNWAHLKLARGTDPRALSILFWALLTGHLAFRLLPPVQSLPSIGQFLEPAGLVGICGLYLQWRRGQLTRTQKLLLGLVCFPLFLFVRIQFLFLTELLLFSIFAAFVLWRENQFKIIAGLAIFCVFVLTLFAATTTVRGAYDNPLEKVLVSAFVYAKLIFAGENIVYTVDRNGIRHSFGSEGRFGALARRTGHIWVFHRVADLSPDIVPYWRGKTYRPLQTSFIPRVFYRDKPLENTGFKFGHRYGILRDGSRTTSLNLPWLTEMLANFGSVGVLVGMALVGLFLAILERLFNATGMNDAEFSLGATILLPIVYPESNFSVMTGSFPLLLASFFICFLITSRISRYIAKS